MGEATSLFKNSRELATHLRALRADRRKRKLQLRADGHKRRALGGKHRKAVLRKTGGLCHICGGIIDGKWAADHVLAHAQGGLHSVENYLPAHSLCNGYRWFYGTEEFQWILKFGVWLRTRIENEESLALELADQFVRYEAQRHRRSKKNGGALTRSTAGTEIELHDVAPRLGR